MNPNIVNAGLPIFHLKMYPEALTTNIITPIKFFYYSFSFPLTLINFTYNI